MGAYSSGASFAKLIGAYSMGTCSDVGLFRGFTVQKIGTVDSGYSDSGYSHSGYSHSAYSQTLDLVTLSPFPKISSGAYKCTPIIVTSLFAALRFYIHYFSFP